MFKTTTTYLVSPTVRLNEIFTNGLPVNSFIDKGRCAIGATHGEIKNISRCTILVVPNISILLNKALAHPELDIVYGDKSYEDVVTMLSVRKPGHKIMTTPEGMSKIMNATVANKRLSEVYNDWFLLLDEAHTFITESYRDGILTPFKYFFKFKKKSIISATPYVFTDERFYKLDYHKITFEDDLATVCLINAISVVGTLDFMLTHPELFPANVHIFYNSVTEIKDAILRAGLTDFTIFCADDKENNNMRKLGDLAKHFVAEPSTGSYSKYNFYTCKYFEGWDLYDTDATVILVTDVYKPHTKVGVGTKGKQAIGRLRDQPYETIHITNHNHLDAMKDITAFKKDYSATAALLIKQNNEYAAECSETGNTFIPDGRLKLFADTDKETNIATLNLMKLDQQINEAASNEIYNNIKYIKKDWEDAYFKVEEHSSDLKLESTTTIKRKSASKQLEEDFLLLQNNNLGSNGAFVVSLFNSTQADVKVSNPLAHQAHKLLDEATMISLKYNVKKVQAAVILKENTLSEVKLLKLLDNVFKVGSTYTNEYIKSKLQEIYTKLNIRDENGKIKIALANQIADSGRFEVQDTKRKGANGKSEHVKLILRKQFELRMAA